MVGEGESLREMEGGTVCRVVEKYCCVYVCLLMSAALVCAVVRMMEWLIVIWC